ncbi:fructose-bisphosphatase class I, partial [Methylobacterium radiotolerans]
MAISAAIGTPLETCLAQAVDANPALKDAAAVVAAVARS